MMTMLTADQLAVVNDSDVLCEGCGANPRDAVTLCGWFVDQVLDEAATPVGQVRCPRCW